MASGVNFHLHPLPGVFQRERADPVCAEAVLISRLDSANTLDRKPGGQNGKVGLNSPKTARPKFFSNGAKGFHEESFQMVDHIFDICPDSRVFRAFRALYIFRL
jgi:hypothetical protein